MTYRFNFTIGKKHHKVLDILDGWKQKGSTSDKICLSIIKQWEEEQRGNKITIYTGEQSKLPTLPPVYEIPHAEDLEGLTYEEKRTLKFAAMEWVRLVDKSIIAEQKQR